MRWSKSSVSSDHPRGCGEHLSRPFSVSRSRGSSPRMRGALVPLETVRNLVGIIPADAGSTITDRYLFSSIQDHPRGCGEHTIKAVYVMPVRGSSPRMRGAPEGVTQGQRRARIIPADAGSTNTVHGYASASMDHPRGCGEHACKVAGVGPDEGSSPRMRGARGVGEQPG